MKAKSAFIVLTFMLSLVVFPSGVASATTFVLEGGINTLESWYSAVNESDLEIVTAASFDVVPTVYTEPGTQVDVQIYTAQEETDPVIGRGEGSFSWNEDEDGGYWHLIVNADSSGVVEIVLHLTTAPLPGRQVVVKAQCGDASPQQWEAVVSTGEYPFSLSGGINTVESWYGASDGVVLNVTTKNPFDVVATVSTAPGFSVQVRIGLEKEDSPLITRGTGSYLWNNSGYWELDVVTDADGIAEIVVHVEGVNSIPGENIFVSAWYGDQAPQSWEAVVSTGEYPFSLSGGINTVESWYGASDGVDLEITTRNPFDVVVTVFTAPQLSVNIEIAVLSAEPVIVKGTGSYTWNEDGYWQLTVVSDSDGVVEVVSQVETVKPVPGENILVSAWYGDQTLQQWSANVSSDLVTIYLPLVCKN